MSLVRAFHVLRALRDDGPATVFELSAELSAPYNSLWHLIYALKAEGLIQCVGRGKRPYGGGVAPTLWGLAPAHYPKQAPYTRRPKKELAPL